MRVLLSLYYPLFDQHLAGGVQVAIRELVEVLARRRLSLRILCPRNDAFAPPRLPGVTILPVLDEDAKEMPAAPSGRLREVITKALRGVDLVWVIDRIWTLPQRRPVVLSLNAHCYPQERAALLDGPWDHLIVPSKTALDHVQALWQTHRETPLGGDCSILPAPVAPRFRPTPVGRHLAASIRFDPQRRYVLFPHRPEEDKGHETALAVIRELSRRDARYHLLIPQAPVARLVDLEPERAFIDHLRRRVADLGVEAHVTFHPWVASADLPSYLSLASCCLFLSRLPETFGLAMVQALACGTPVVSSGAGALTEVVPPSEAHKVVFTHDPVAIADCIVAGAPRAALAQARRRIAAACGLDSVVDRLVTCFESVIENHSGGRAPQRTTAGAACRPWPRNNGRSRGRCVS